MTGVDRARVIERMNEAMMLLTERMDARLIPETGMNIAYALPDARSKDDVAAVRIRQEPEGMESFDPAHLSGAVDHPSGVGEEHR